MKKEKIIKIIIGIIFVALVILGFNILLDVYIMKIDPVLGLFFIFIEFPILAGIVYWIAD